ncbi:MAG: type-F conjugative transfer system pilin assembly protein TrbC [Rickettsia sp.]|uniref:type-F conjugative transfer system pilin assembly protein TrbC n=1 Tax=Rickettsia sp. TaxID=789 RepID=UPI00397D5FCD
MLQLVVLISLVFINLWVFADQHNIENIDKLEVSDEDMEFAKNLHKQVRRQLKIGLEDKYSELKALSSIQDSGVIAQGTNIDSDNIDDNTRLRVLVSSSMSMNLLRSYYKEAQKYGAHLVFNGLPNGSFKELLKLAQEIVGSSEIGGIEIDDEAFKTFKAMQVPMIVLSEEEDSFFNQEGATSKYDSIQGAVSIKYALEEFAIRGDLNEEAKQRLAR